MRGSIVRVRQDKGFCFVRAFDEQADRFLHFSDIINAEPDLVREGLAVEFDGVEGPKGPRAVRARLEIGDDRTAPAQQFDELFSSEATRRLEP